MLAQVKNQLGKNPLVTKVEDHLVNTECQGGIKVEVHASRIDFQGQWTHTGAAWLHQHPILEDTIQFQSSEDPIKTSQLTQTALDAACGAAGCNNGASCALKRGN